MSRNCRHYVNTYVPWRKWWHANRHVLIMYADQTTHKIQTCSKKQKKMLFGIKIKKKKHICIREGYFVGNWGRECIIDCPRAVRKHQLFPITCWDKHQILPSSKCLCYESTTSFYVNVIKNGFTERLFEIKGVSLKSHGASTGSSWKQNWQLVKMWTQENKSLELINHRDNNNSILLLKGNCNEIIVVGPYCVTARQTNHYHYYSVHQW